MTSSGKSPKRSKGQKSTSITAPNIFGKILASQIKDPKLTCMSALHLLGRLTGKANSAQRGTFSMNTLGFWGTLNKLSVGTQTKARQLRGVSGNVLRVFRAKSEFERMFNMFTVTYGAYSKYAILGGASLQIVSLIRGLAQSANETRNGTKEIAERFMAGLNFTENVGLLLLLLLTFNCNEFGNLSDNSHGLYTMGVWIQVSHNLLFKKMYNPLKQIISRMPSLANIGRRMEKGIFCREVDELNAIVQKANSIPNVRRSARKTSKRKI